MAIQKIVSKRVELPLIYLVETEADWNELPKGLPRIMAHSSELGFIRTYLEFQVLLKSCLETKLPIKWMECLKRFGFESNMRQYSLSSGGTYSSSGVEGTQKLEIDQFITDQYFVDFDKLSDLKLLPVWLEDVRAGVEANIINEVIFDPCAFNKQIGMNIGAAATKINKRNLIINDVSGSIPNGVVMTTARLTQLMSRRFHADVITTGGRTYFTDYDDVPSTDFIKLAEKCGRSNEGVMFNQIVKQHKDYGTIVCFGDNDSPEGYENKMQYNFTVDTLYSLHTDCARTNKLTGYCKGFKPKTVHIVRDWISSIEK